MIAPYGILQSLVRPRDLTATLEAVRRVLEPGGLLGIDLVPDVPNWREYENRVQMKGRIRGRSITLIESVRQDPRRRVTVFEQRYVERRRGRTPWQRAGAENQFHWRQPVPQRRRPGGFNVASSKHLVRPFSAAASPVDVSSMQHLWGPLCRAGPVI